MGEWLEFYGPLKAPDIAEILGIEGERIQGVLESLLDSERIIAGHLVAEGPDTQICDRENFETLLRLARADAVPAFEPLAAEWLALFLATFQGMIDSGGGIDRLADHMERLPVQLGGSYPASVEAQEAVDRGRAAAAALVGADPAEIVLGPSSTVLARRLARALRPTWSAGDELIVTDLDHEANIGGWRALEETGIVVRDKSCELSTR